MKNAQENKSKPVIMQVLPALEQGGVERTAVDIAAALVQNDFDAIVVSSGGPMVHELNRTGATHITLPVDSKNPLTIKRNIKRLGEIIKAYKVNIVHVRSRAPAWSAYFAAKSAGIPFVTTFHGTYNLGGFLKKKYNAIMTKGDRVIANSDFIRRHIMDNYKLKWTPIRVIARGVNINYFDPQKVPAERVVKLATEWRLPDGVPVVMLPGRLTSWKGQLLLIKALSKLDRDVRCLLVGSSQGRAGYVEEIEALTAKLKLTDSVHIIDNCRDMPAAFKLADVIVSASTDPEAFGRVAVEGQAMGRPVVAPNHGGAPEQITPNITGWLFKPSDADDLARKLDKALSLTAEERSLLHERCIQNVHDKFTNDLMCKKTLDIYRELLAKPDGASE